MRRDAITWLVIVNGQLIKSYTFSVYFVSVDLKSFLYRLKPLRKRSKLVVWVDVVVPIDKLIAIMLDSSSGHHVPLPFVYLFEDRLLFIFSDEVFD